MTFLVLQNEDEAQKEIFVNIKKKRFQLSKDSGLELEDMGGSNKEQKKLETNNDKTVKRNTINQM